MPAIAYPATLPCPQTAAFTPADRVRRSDLPGLMQFSGRERDFRGLQEVSFTFNESEAAIFYVWWRNALLRGGLWFSASDWPVPRGWAQLTVRRFTSPPQWSALGSGFWRVSAATELRGRSLLPKLQWQITKIEEGWRYRVDLLSAPVDYSAADYDDSAWDIGQAPFGDGPHPYQTGVWPDPNTIVPLNRQVWLRRTESIPALSEIAIHVKADNVPTLWINGEPVTLVQQGVFPDPSEFLYEATYMPSSYELVFALRVVDDEESEPGDHIYAGLAAEYA